MVVHRSKLRAVFDQCAANKIYVNISDSLTNVHSIDQLNEIVAVHSAYLGYIFLILDDESDYSVMDELVDEGSAVIRIGFIGKRQKDTIKIGKLIERLFVTMGYFDVEWNPDMGNNIAVVLCDTDIQEDKLIRTHKLDSASESDTDSSDIDSDNSFSASDDDDDEIINRIWASSHLNLAPPKSKRTVSLSSNNTDDTDVDIPQIKLIEFDDEDTEDEDIENDDTIYEHNEDDDDEDDDDYVQFTNIPQVEHEPENNECEIIKEELEKEVETKIQNNSKDVQPVISDEPNIEKVKPIETIINIDSDSDFEYQDCPSGCKCFNCKSEAEELAAMNSIH